LHWIGKVCHYNYEFEKPLAKHAEYKEVLNPSNKAFLTAVNRDLAITKNTLMLKENPVEIQILTRLTQNIVLKLLEMKISCTLLHEDQKKLEML
jgi:hypothetical protein